MMKWVLGAATATALPLLASAALASETITVMAYSGLFEERYKEAVIKPFEEANPDVTVNYFGLPSSGQMLGQLRAQQAAPQVDVVILDVTVSKAGTDEGIFEMLDESEIPSIADLYESARFPGVAGVGVTFDNLALLYNPELVDTPPTSIADLSSEAVEGKVSFPGMPDTIGLSTIILLDTEAGGGGLETHYEVGFEGMGRIAPNVLTWQPQPEIYPVIITGQATVGMGWNARAQYNADASEGRLAGVIADEGTIFQINTINLVSNAPSTDAAKRFIEYALSPEAQKSFTEDMYYAPTNATAEIAPEAAERTAVVHMDRVVAVDWLEIAEQRDALMEKWRREVLPLSR